MAMSRRPRPTGGRHPPLLTPTVSAFKPRAEWNNAGSSMFLYVNLPGFYRDQIQIKSDEKTRTIQIQGQRPLSAQTRARFNEYYKVPEICDMSRPKTSFVHGLLTIEMPIVDVTQKQDKRVDQDQGKSTQKPRVDGSLGRKQDPEDEKPKVAEMGEGKPEGRRMSAADGILERKKDEKQAEQKAKENEGEGSLGRKKQEKDVKPEGFQVTKQEKGVTVKRREELDGTLGSKQPKKEEEKPVGEKKKASEEQKMKDREEVDGTLGSKQPEKEDKLIEKRETEEQTQDLGKQKKPGERDLDKDVVLDEELRKSDFEDPKKEKPVAEDEQKGIGDEIFHDANAVVFKDQKEIDGDKTLPSSSSSSSYAGDSSLMNVGVAALVIMGFGAYVFLPFFKLFY